MKRYTGTMLLKDMIKNHITGFPCNDQLKKWIAHIREGDREWHSSFNTKNMQAQIYLKEIPVEIKPKSCHKCGGTSIWICSTYEGKIQKHAYELGLCVECGCVLHTLFGCQNNTCEWHDNCVECGSELCLDINGGCCYKCDKEIDQEEANLAFEFFGDDSSR